MNKYVVYIILHKVLVGFDGLYAVLDGFRTKNWG